MMEFLWLFIGLAVGVIGAWLFFEARTRARLAEQEVRLSETNRRIQRALERELSAHEGTKHRLNRMNDEDKINKERMESLNTDVDAGRQVLESVQADAAAKGVEIARLELRIEELTAELETRDAQLEEFDTVVARARSHSDSTTEDIMAKLARLESRLKTDEDDDAGQDEGTAQGADTAQTGSIDVYEAEIAELKSQLQAKEDAIASLKADIAADQPGDNEKDAAKTGIDAESTP